jgi:hypothetical protein
MAVLSNLLRCGIDPGVPFAPLGNWLIAVRNFRLTLGTDGA